MDVDKLKKRDLLQAFDLVTTKGKKTDGVYELSGVKASQDFDGYTCWLSFKDLTVTLLFHGAFDMDYEDEDTQKAFFKKISNMLDDKDSF
ncbi:DUF3081 family protein [Psychromonas sp. SR45-3]|uniref:DUF3081 family protein n=1 Tax=Psychromonas sp. SR45-3 TaxID=2760930 RepID=UPI0015F7A1ED|nr:DUF3081 family protein [Psychromonas sp. SR45-3]MBB1271899.1 DUF3081 domain-containing protein [Psychromonas sp. SR45-3]